jgi:hypothetical protein
VVRCLPRKPSSADDTCDTWLLPAELGLACVAICPMCHARRGRRSRRAGRQRCASVCPMCHICPMCHCGERPGRSVISRLRDRPRRTRGDRGRALDAPAWESPAGQAGRPAGCRCGWADGRRGHEPAKLVEPGSASTDARHHLFVLPRARLVEPERPAGVVLRGLSPTSGRAISGAAYPGGDVTLADRGLAGIRSQSREVRLTLKQERFLAEYLISLNATQAAIRN